MSGTTFNVYVRKREEFDVTLEENTFNVCMPSHTVFNIETEIPGVAQNYPYIWWFGKYGMPVYYFPQQYWPLGIGKSEGELEDLNSYYGSEEYGEGYYGG